VIDGIRHRRVAYGGYKLSHLSRYYVSQKRKESETQHSPEAYTCKLVQKVPKKEIRKFDNS